MKPFVKNTGQYHPGIAYVAQVEATDDYHGAGPVELLRDGLEITGFRYTDATPPGWKETDDQVWPRPAELDAAFPGRMHAMASCHEICVDHGTAAAALLNITAKRQALSTQTFNLMRRGGAH